ncbi:MAG: hypothetical protein P8Y71_16405 [Pseudolabrys sp.]
MALDAAAERDEGFGGRIPAPGLDMGHRGLERLLETAVVVCESVTDGPQDQNIESHGDRRLIEIKARPSALRKTARWRPRKSELLNGEIFYTLRKAQIVIED